MFVTYFFKSEYSIIKKKVNDKHANEYCSFFSLLYAKHIVTVSLIIQNNLCIFYKQKLCNDFFPKNSNVL